MNVGVAPTCSPEEDSIVTLCGSERAVGEVDRHLARLRAQRLGVVFELAFGVRFEADLSTPPDSRGGRRRRGGRRAGRRRFGCGARRRRGGAGRRAAAAGQRQQRRRERERGDREHGASLPDLLLGTSRRILHWSGSSADTTPPGADPSRRRCAAGAAVRRRAYAAQAPGATTVCCDGARARDPHAPHAQGLRRRGARRGDARRAVRARALGAQPPPHQPVALSRARRAHARAPDGAGRSGQPGSAVKLRRAPTLVAVSATVSGDAAQDREDLLATAVAAYIVLLGAHARGLAGYWRTVPLLDDPPARELLGLGDDEAPVGLLYLGTPVQQQRVPERAPLASSSAISTEPAARRAHGAAGTTTSGPSACAQLGRLERARSSRCDAGRFARGTRRPSRGSRSAACGSASARPSAATGARRSREACSAPIVGPPPTGTNSRSTSPIAAACSSRRPLWPKSPMWQTRTPSSENTKIVFGPACGAGDVVVLGGDRRRPRRAASRACPPSSAARPARRRSPRPRCGRVLVRDQQQIWLHACDRGVVPLDPAVAAERRHVAERVDRHRSLLAASGGRPTVRTTQRACCCSSL